MLPVTNISRRAFPLSENTIQKIRNEIEVYGADNTIRAILDFRHLSKRKDENKTLKNALKKLLFSLDEKYQLEIFNLLTDFANSKKPVTDRSKTSSIVPIANVSESITKDWEGHNFRIQIKENGDLEFDAEDVCYCLGLTQISQALARLDQDEKTTNIFGRKVITEAGLYNLALSGRTGASKRFRRWVTHEVLPSIKKHGGYIDSEATTEQLQLLQAQIVDMNNLLIEKEKTIYHLESNQRNDSDRLFSEIYKTIKRNENWNVNIAMEYIIQYLQRQENEDAKKDGRKPDKIYAVHLIDNPARASEAIRILKEAS